MDRPDPARRYGLIRCPIAHPVFAGKLAIVIDDFGYRPHTENQVLALPPNISVAVLPNAP
ncbi:divergent polysaccharide deacetylase family protein, partial [Salmonella enterica subsp. enterica serovar Virginia]|nr:divergent polysaccharide deacetylase family protein [Salmonella enterica subsp. enterica serovar Virginia]